MHTRLYDYLLKYNVLISEQFGFRKNHSTDQSIVNFTKNILHEINNGMFCYGLFMDLSKAFDTIDHHILLKKLYHYGVRGVPHQWFSDYLYTRKQYVVADGVESDIMNVNTGVPQGLVLGPLLFIIYINDIISSSKLLMFSLFANDMVEYHSHSNVTRLVSILNEELIN